MESRAGKRERERNFSRILDDASLAISHTDSAILELLVSQLILIVDSFILFQFIELANGTFQEDHIQQTNNSSRPALARRSASEPSTRRHHTTRARAPLLKVQNRLDCGASGREMQMGGERAARVGGDGFNCNNADFDSH